MKSFEDLNNLFNIENVPAPTKKLDVVIVPEQTKQEDQEDDYQLARKTLRNLINQNDSVLENLVDLAKNSEHPRSYEVVGQLLKTQSEMAKDLLNIHKQVKDIQPEDAAPTKVGTQNNIVFAGSTSELLKAMRQQNEKIIDNEKE